MDETVAHVLWECHRFEEERREFLAKAAVEDTRLGLREVMEGEGDRVRVDVGKTEDVMLTQNSKTSADIDVFFTFSATMNFQRSAGE